MKCHIGVDADSGLVHTVRGTPGNVNDVVGANSMPYRQEHVVFADAGYQGTAKRPDARAGVNWRIALRSGRRRTLDKGNEIEALID